MVKRGFSVSGAVTVSATIQVHEIIAELTDSIWIFPHGGAEYKIRLDRLGKTEGIRRIVYGKNYIQIENLW
jgi:hypothetical protein